MRCPKCQFDNPEEMNFCGKCATDSRIDKETPPKSDYHPRSYTPKFLAEKILTSRGSIEGERKRIPSGIQRFLLNIRYYQLWQ